MSDSPERTRELSSWKEIAVFLGISVRAAQNWERERGLPVKRLPGKRSVVSASPAELDGWRSSQEAAAGTPARTARGVIGIGLGILALLVTTAGYAAYHLVSRRGGLPSTFRVEQNAVIVLDDRGQTLWRKVFPQNLIQDEYNKSDVKTLHRFWVGDLDSDGRPEVLFVEQSAAYSDPGYLLCYSASGNLKWQFRVGKRVTSKRSLPSDIFRIKDFAVAPLGRNGAPVIVVTSAQAQVPDYPDQVVLLDANGKCLGEYWHSGWLEFVAVSGHDIFLGGVSNGNHAATIVVLNANDVSGVSAESDPDFQISGFPLAHEKARVFFPRTCINRTKEPYNYLTVMTLNGDTVTAEIAELPPPTPALIWYQLGLDLQLKGVEPHDTFISLHSEMQAKNQLDHGFSTKEREALRNVRVVRNGE